MRLKPQEDGARVHFSESEYQTLLDAAPSRRVRLALRIEAECSPRIGLLVTLRRKDFYIPNDPDVKIAFVRIRGAKDTTDGDNDLGGKARISWVPADLYESIEAYCEAEGIGEEDELFDIGETRMSQLVAETRDNAAIKAGNEDFQYVTSHDFRAYFATNLVRRQGVSKEIVMEMGGWKNKKSMDPYLAVPLPQDIQNELARAGVVERDVPTPPQRDELETVYQAVRSLKKSLVGAEVEDVQDGSSDEQTSKQASLTTGWDGERGKESVSGPASAFLEGYLDVTAKTERQASEVWEEHIGVNVLGRMSQTPRRRLATGAVGLLLATVAMVWLTASALSSSALLSPGAGSSPELAGLVIGIAYSSCRIAREDESISRTSTS